MAENSGSFREIYGGSLYNYFKEDYCSNASGCDGNSMAVSANAAHTSSDGKLCNSTFYYLTRHSMVG